jgi:hypothetical protein
VKEKYAFIADTYVGWRSPDNLESVTGNYKQELLATYKAYVMAIKVVESIAEL